MEMKHNQHASPRGLVDIPLPGHFPCLTWQLNVTLHPSSRLIKFVSVVREPIAQIEVARGIMDPVEWELGRVQTLAQAEESMRTLGYLSGLSKGI